MNGDYEGIRKVKFNKDDEKCESNSRAMEILCNEPLIRKRSVKSAEGIIMPLLFSRYTRGSKRKLLQIGFENGVFPFSSDSSYCQGYAVEWKSKSFSINF